MPSDQPIRENPASTTVNLWHNGQTAPPPPTGPQMFEIAQRYLAAGLSLLPIATDGSKRPAWGMLPRAKGASGTEKHGWGVLQSRMPTVDELRFWYSCFGPPCGLAIVCGAISGGLEVIDIDNFDLADPWMKLVGEQDPTLLDRLVMVLTPRPGLHVYIRSPACGSNEKLAEQYRPPDAEIEGSKLKTLIETKSEGGYVLAPGSPGYCHPSGRQYTYFSARDLTQIPMITGEERALLINVARSFNQVERRPASSRRPQHRLRAPNSARPGDDYNARADWFEILTQHGWTLFSEDGEGKQCWCRPGKDWGVSATVNYAGNDLLHVFSSNAPHLEPGRSYNKFQFVALVEYGGDFQTARWALRAAGYGRQLATTGHLRGRGRGRRGGHRPS